MKRSSIVCRRLVLGGIVGLLATACGGGSGPNAATAPTRASHSDSSLTGGPTPPPTSLDPRILAVIPTGPAAHGVTVGFGSVWVANHHGGSVTRVDPATNKGVATIPLGVGPGRMTVGYGYVWVDDYNGTGFWRIDPKTNRATELWSHDDGGLCANPAAGNGAVWVIGGDRGPLFKVDPVTGKVLAKARIDACGATTEASGGVTTGAGSVWLGTGKASILRLDPRTLSVLSTIRAPEGGRLALGPYGFGAGSLWVSQVAASVIANGDLLRIDPGTGRVVARIGVGSGPDDVCVAGHFVWVVNVNDGTVSQISPASNKVVATVEIGGNEDFGLACGFGSVWATRFDQSTVTRVRATAP